MRVVVLRAGRPCRALLRLLLLTLFSGSSRARADEQITLRAPLTVAPAFDHMGASVFWDQHALLYIKSSRQHYREAAPTELTGDVKLLSLYEGSVWLRVGSLFAHYRSNPDGWTRGIWHLRQLELPDGTRYDDARIHEEGRGGLIVEQSATGAPVLLRETDDGIHVSPAGDTPAREIPKPDPYGPRLAVSEGRCVVRWPPGPQSDGSEEPLPELATADGKCRVTLMRESGASWLVADKWLASRGYDDWLFISHEALPLEPTRRRRPWRMPRISASWLLPVPPALAIAGGAFATRESTYWRSSLRATGATVGALPLSALYITAWQMRGSRELHPVILAPFLALSAPLPALGAWGVGKLADDGASKAGRGFVSALGGTLVGVLLSTPCAQLVKRDEKHLWLAIALSTAITGLTTSIGYSLGASLP